MNEPQTPISSDRARVLRALAIGALVVGGLDGLDALIFFGLRGVAPGRIFQSIASGLLGRGAFQGGLSTITLGVALHFLIALIIVIVYYLVSRRFRMLTDYPVWCGVAYGIVVYAVMNLVVIPLSAAARGSPSLPVVLNGLAIHALGVGVPAALAARRAQGASVAGARPGLGS